MTVEPGDGTSLVVVATFQDLAEAHMARGLLDANGLPSLVMNGEMSSAIPTGVVGGVQLAVPSPLVARAQALLSDPPDDLDMADFNEQDW
ncbi:MAG: DUF2007 domain-containing protein [Rhodospirillales bacterium]|nr:MAG: DUF2007 domain-containing protein [Rhodospirillales bacterium]